MRILALCAGLAAMCAAQEYKNLEILKGAPPARVDAAMKMFNRVLGVECTHCHVEGAFEKEDKPQFATTRKMFRMVVSLQKEVKVACWTCHRGHSKPQQPTGQLSADWPLPKLSEEDAKKPASQVFKNIQTFKNLPAGRFPLIMNMFSKSLGVKCDHCHVPDDWASEDKPQKQTARKMLAMVTANMREFWGSQTPINCYTCHRESIKPETSPPPA